MEDNSIDIELDHENMHYKGWVMPSDKKNKEGLPASYHVVLNQVLFGNLSRNQDKWSVDDWRPHELVQAVGKCIEEKVIPVITQQKN